MNFTTEKRYKIALTIFWKKNLMNNTGIFYLIWLKLWFQKNSDPYWTNPDPQPCLTASFSDLRNVRVTLLQARSPGTDHLSLSGTQRRRWIRTQEHGRRAWESCPKRNQVRFCFYLHMKVLFEQFKMSKSALIHHILAGKQVYWI
jgi:hypothetical protein